MASLQHFCNTIRHLGRRRIWVALFMTIAPLSAAAQSDEAQTSGAKPPRLSNDNATLIARTDFTGPKLKLDFPGLKIGVAEYEEGPTGCTVFEFPKGTVGTVDIRGGAPGTISTGHLVNRVGPVSAISFAGGSQYGVEAATGVAAELLARRKFSTAWWDIAVVPGAIIFDYPRRGNAIYPDKALGRAAMRAAVEGEFLLGARGAGRNASVGEDREPSGQGGAFRRIGETRIAFFTVVNAVGAVVDREGNVVRGNLNRKTGRRERSSERAERRATRGAGAQPGNGNTTISLFVTNQKLSTRELRQLANQIHSSMARAIQPFHSMNDGDVLFAVTTGEVANSKLSAIDLATLASELAWDAVLSAVSAED